MIRERKTYRSGPTLLFEFLGVGLFSGLFLRMPYMVIARNFFYIPYYLEIPVCTVIGFGIGFIFLFCTYTTVYIENGNVTITKRFRKHVYPVDERISLGEHNINVRGVSLVQRWLIIKPLFKEVERKYRLNGFSDRTCEKLINELNLIHRQNMPQIVKDLVTESSWEGEESSILYVEQTIKREWKSVRTNALVWIGLLVAVTLLTLLNKRDWHTYRYAIYAAALLVCVIGIPFEVIRTKRNAKRCVFEVSFKGDHLMINDDHYMIPDIISITVTHESIKSRSLYSVQRYITIRNHEGIHKYWVGSEDSISADEYRGVVRVLLNAFVNYPDKLKYLTKRPFWNK